jgi:hypothetical protein
LRQSRETQVLGQSPTGKPLLIRPIRPQQPEDTVFIFGNDTWTEPDPRTNGVSGPTFTDSELAEWTRVHRVQSETWEWNNNGWRPTDATGLMGLIDPALAYNEGRQRVVAYGGVPPFIYCDTYASSSQSNCELLGRMTWTWEFDGSTWSSLALPGSPPPRVRASMVGFGEDTVLFGGRAVEPEGRAHIYGAALPDNMTLGLLNDTWLYDGTKWSRVPVSNPPPAREGAQLVYDSARGRAVLIAGNTLELPSQDNDPVDVLSIWEFDGTDWVERIAADDPALPATLRGRKGMVAFWHPERRTVVLFGGSAAIVETCPLSGAELDAALQQALSDQILRQQLTEQGCKGGYVHDSWEWDGRALRQLTHVAFGGYDDSVPVFRQVRAPGGWATNPRSDAPAEPVGPTSLWPWRYDARAEHFALRSTLERAHHSTSAQTPSAHEGASPPITDTAPSSTELVSPLFTARARPQVAYQPGTGKLLIFTAKDSRVFETDGDSWNDRTPTTTPFSAGLNDFFAAAWDGAQDKIILFDPRTAETWAYAADGWARVPTPQSATPPVWSVSKDVRSENDATGWGGTLFSAAGTIFPDVALKIPRMVYDSTRQRQVMLYQDALWELGASGWQQQALPTGLTQCTAATLLAYDGLRQRTVAVGCKVPAQTWEWDGSAWTGPGPSPYTATLRREPLTTFNDVWSGTVQLAWAHPNALSPAPSLGGVVTLDSDAALKIWDGAQWREGPRADATASPGYHSNQAFMLTRYWQNFAVGTAMGWVDDLTAPMAFFPPIIEDPVGHRLLAFKDWIHGIEELDLQEPESTRDWLDVSRYFLGPAASLPQWSYPHIYPHPFELLSAPTVDVKTIADPASRTMASTGQPPTGSVLEEVLLNLWWPYRIFVDYDTNRMLMLTHRGVVWKMGMQALGSLGDSCTTMQDCGEGAGCIEGVCCNNGRCGGLCTTCVGTNPGICESIPQGEPDPRGGCGSGDCAKVCPGNTVPPPTGTHIVSCVYLNEGRECGPSSCQDGVLTPRGQCALNANTCNPPSSTTICPGGLDCADDTSCNTQCDSRLDCKDSYSTCSVDGTACVPDSVAQEAAARGVTPVSWTPPARRSNEEIASLLAQAGYERDEQGRVLLSEFDLGGLVKVFDPNLRTPLTALQGCIQRLTACAAISGNVDGCIAAAPRCVTTTPWQNDPGGPDCCPEACLVEYLSGRATQSAQASLNGLLESDCFPGFDEFYQELQTP